VRRTVLCLLVVVNVGALLCQAQVGPLVAKRHVVRDVLDSEGNVVRHSETFGRYLRNSAGSTIDQEYSLQGGKLAVESGQLRDYSRHKIYELIYENHQAVELADLPGEPHPEYLADAKSASGQETTNGIPCLIHSIYMIVDGKKRLIGKGYDSAEYGVPVREDALSSLPGGPAPTRSWNYTIFKLLSLIQRSLTWRTSRSSRSGLRPVPSRALQLRWLKP